MRHRAKPCTSQRVPLRNDLVTRCIERNYIILAHSLPHGKYCPPNLSYECAFMQLTLRKRDFSGPWRVQVRFGTKHAKEQGRRTASRAGESSRLRDGDWPFMDGSADGASPAPPSTPPGKGCEEHLHDRRNKNMGRGDQVLSCDTASQERADSPGAGHSLRPGSGANSYVEEAGYR